MKGIDEDWGKPSPQSIVDAGYSFVVGYVSEDDTGKNMTATRAAELRAAGLAVCLVYEYWATEALNGYSAGLAKGRLARSMASALGFPALLPIYAAVDFNATDAQMPVIMEYLRGFADGNEGMSFVGTYGPYNVVRQALSTGVVGWGWQTYAWSDGMWYDGAQVRQVRNGITVGGVQVDEDLAMADHIGQWEGNMDLTTDPNFSALIWRTEAVFNDRATVAGGPYVGEENKLHTRLGELESKLDSLTTAVAALAAQLPPAVNVTDAGIATELVRQLSPTTG